MKKLITIIYVLLLVNLGYSVVTINENIPTSPDTKIYISSQIIVNNSLIINGNSIHSTRLKEDIINVLSSTTISIPKRLKVEELNIQTSGLNSNGRGKFNNDIEVTDSSRGLILTSSSTYKFMLWVDNNGNLFTTQISASPEISYEERIIRLKADRLNKENLKIQYKNIPKANIKDRLDILEQILGLQ